MLRQKARKPKADTVPAVAEERNEALQPFTYHGSMIYNHDGVTVEVIDPVEFVAAGRPAELLPTHVVTGELLDSALTQDYYFRIQYPDAAHVEKIAASGQTYVANKAKLLAGKAIFKHLHEIAPAYFPEEKPKVERNHSLGFLHRQMLQMEEGDPTPSFSLCKLDLISEDLAVIVTIDSDDFDIRICLGGRSFMKSCNMTEAEDVVGTITAGAAVWKLTLAHTGGCEPQGTRHQRLLMGTPPTEVRLAHLQRPEGTKSLQKAIAANGQVSNSYLTVDLTGAKIQWS